METRLVFRANNVRARLNGSARREVQGLADVLKEADAVIGALRDEITELREREKASTFARFRREMAKVHKLIIEAHAGALRHDPTAQVVERIFKAREATAKLLGEGYDARS